MKAIIVLLIAAVYADLLATSDCRYAPCLAADDLKSCNNGATCHEVGTGTFKCCPEGSYNAAAKSCCDNFEHFVDTACCPKERFFYNTSNLYAPTCCGATDKYFLDGSGKQRCILATQATALNVHVAGTCDDNYFWCDYRNTCTGGKCVDKTTRYGCECTVNADCDADMQCWGTTKVCINYQSQRVGDDCLNTDACKPGLTCTGGKCVAPALKANGEVCTYSLQCTSSYCNTTSEYVLEGICKDKVNTNDPCFKQTCCKATDYCNGTNVVDSKCLVKKDDNADCVYSYECKILSCYQSKCQNPPAPVYQDIGAACDATKLCNPQKAFCGLVSASNICVAFNSIARGATPTTTDPRECKWPVRTLTTYPADAIYAWDGNLDSTFGWHAVILSGKCAWKYAPAGETVDAKEECWSGVIDAAKKCVDVAGINCVSNGILNQTLCGNGGCTCDSELVATCKFYTSVPVKYYYEFMYTWGLDFGWSGRISAHNYGWIPASLKKGFAVSICHAECGSNYIRPFDINCGAATATDKKVCDKALVSGTMSGCGSEPLVAPLQFKLTLDISAGSMAYWRANKYAGLMWNVELDKAIFATEYEYDYVFDWFDYQSAVDRVTIIVVVMAEGIDAAGIHTKMAGLNKLLNYNIVAKELPATPAPVVTTLPPAGSAASLVPLYVLLLLVLLL